MRWDSLSLRSQVTIVVLLFWMIMQGIAVYEDLAQIQSANDYEMDQRGGGFLAEALPILAETPLASRKDVANRFTNFERQIIVSDQNAADAVEDGENHDTEAKWIYEQLRAMDIPVVELSATDRHIKPAGGAEGTFVNFRAPQKAGEKATVDRGATVGVFSTRLSGDDQWYNFYLLMSAKTFWPVFFQKSIDSLFALVLLIVLAGIIGRVMAPLGDLASNAERFGRGETTGALQPKGSVDVRDTIISFNRMEKRIAHMLSYQVAMLRSLGHDLKGPLARLRDLTEEIKPESAQEQVSNKLSTVESFVHSVEEFTRNVQQDKTTSRIDLASLLEVLVDEQVEAGHDASISIEAESIVPGRYNALTRVFRNLIENAIKYGVNVHVTVSESQDQAVVFVDDDGPGIRDEDIEEAFEPFQRLEADGPGSGLGLAIVRTIVIDHGGTVSLSNREGGGLRATVSLPKETSDQPT
ncbi:MAG: ATP-binding protein [Rhodobacteraceae bacterium]|nr:ATP-binding protein [Paracoccaceae bacterium]